MQRACPRSQLRMGEALVNCHAACGQRNDDDRPGCGHLRSRGLTPAFLPRLPFKILTAQKLLIGDNHRRSHGCRTARMDRRPMSSSVSRGLVLSGFCKTKGSFSAVCRLRSQVPLEAAADNAQAGELKARLIATADEQLAELARQRFSVASFATTYSHRQIVRTNYPGYSSRWHRGGHA